MSAVVLGRVRGVDVDSAAARFQPGSSPLITRPRRRVLAAVELDDESAIGANEIRDELAERDLTAEFQPQQTPVTQARPQTLFDIGLICAEAARDCSGHAPA